MVYFVEDAEILVVLDSQYRKWKSGNEKEHHTEEVKE